MGSGAWSRTDFDSYVKTSCSYKGIKATVDSLGVLSTSASNQEMFTSRQVHDALNPKNVMRECCDSEEHPNTMPVILALDMTGSMGEAAVEVAKRLNNIMTTLYEKVSDVEFCIMGIGDLEYDSGPIQISQFESDIRIAEQLDKLWFEFGGGGNWFESYTAAWYMGSRHCKLDCWNRGKKGIIITMGDERLNPYLPKNPLSLVTGDALEADVETKALFEEVTQKYDVYHINVVHDGRNFDRGNIASSFSCLGENFKESNMDSIADTIINIVLNAQSANANSFVQPVADNNYGISW